MLWHSIWINNQAGLDLFVEILPILTVASPAAANTAATIIDRFTDTFDSAQRHDLDLLTAIRPASFRNELLSIRENGFTPERQVKLTMRGLGIQPPNRDAANALIGELADWQSAVLILQTRLQGQGGKAEVVAKLRAAAKKTRSAKLQQVIGNEAADIAGRLIWAGRNGTAVRTRSGLEAAKLATEILSDDATAWYRYAVALRLLKRRKEALAAYDKAITLDPDDAYFCRGRGIALDDMGRYGEALAAYDKAITLDPYFAWAHMSRGNSLDEMGRYEEALAAYDKAITLAPDNSDVHSSRGGLLIGMGRHGEALQGLNCQDFDVLGVARRVVVTGLAGGATAVL